MNRRIAACVLWSTQSVTGIINTLTHLSELEYIYFRVNMKSKSFSYFFCLSRYNRACMTWNSYQITSYWINHKNAPLTPTVMPNQVNQKQTIQRKTESFTISQCIYFQFTQRYTTLVERSETSLRVMQMRANQITCSAAESAFTHQPIRMCLSPVIGLYLALFSALRNTRCHTS